ncbi:MAG: CDP-glucose 4,6-dehydratase [Nitrospiraceae bacterium]|nr:CDP-glucose 4,6-dehydratase [Nitrospiraceae bacterium]
MFGNIYNGRRVFVTGHTGFKGSWLCLWLQALGADVAGYSLEPQTEPGHYNLLGLDMASVIGDIRDGEKLKRAIGDHRPEAVFHLAAQPLVRYSYRHPVETFETNVVGTSNLLEACREPGSVRAIVNVTSDKCYENREWVWGYRESDALGGYDPYSASKACQEIVAGAYRSSFFNPGEYGVSHQVLLASARAGNVIGGGDWSEDRLIPDIVRAISENKKLLIRNPRASRPWQHVLDPLSGYLMLGQKLLEGRKEFAEGWNFGPEAEAEVEDVVKGIKRFWDRFEYEIQPDGAGRHEAGALKLDCSKARKRLKWRPNWDREKTFGVTAQWYKRFHEEGRAGSRDDLDGYVEDAGNGHLEWTA